MNPASVIARARRRAGYTQRELAARAGLAQPALARLEAGRVIPRVDTLERILRACGRELETARRPGIGVDRSAIRAMLRLSPEERLELAVREARNLDRLLRSRRA
jgi:transcriptional regulator with XRE-family HTH domain